MSSNQQPNRREYSEAEIAYIGVFMRRLGAYLWNRGLCRNDKDNDDIVGYATEWLFRNFAKWYASYPNPATLASVVARHRAVEWLRRETRQAGPHLRDEDNLPLPLAHLDEAVDPDGYSDDDATPKSEFVAGAGDVADIVIDAETAAMLEQALLGILTKKQSEAFFAVRIDGKRVKEVAANLGVEANVVTQRVRQAERVLKEVLANEPWRLLGR